MSFSCWLEGGLLIIHYYRLTATDVHCCAEIIFASNSNQSHSAACPFAKGKSVAIFSHLHLLCTIPMRRPCAPTGKVVASVFMQHSDIQAAEARDDADGHQGCPYLCSE